MISRRSWNNIDATTLDFFSLCKARARYLISSAAGPHFAAYQVCNIWHLSDLASLRFFVSFKTAPSPPTVSRRPPIHFSNHRSAFFHNMFAVAALASLLSAIAVKAVPCVQFDSSWNLYAFGGDQDVMIGDNTTWSCE